MREIKLTDRQMAALDAAGAFENAVDEHDEAFAAAYDDDERTLTITTETKQPLWRALVEYLNAADAEAEDKKRNDAEQRRWWRADREVLSKLANKVFGG